MKFMFKPEISTELELLQLELFSELPVKLLLIWPKLVRWNILYTYALSFKGSKIGLGQE